MESLPQPTPVTPEAIQHFEPEKLGLDLDRRDDHALYVDACGDEILAHILLRKRDLFLAVRTSDMTSEAFHEQCAALDDAYAERYQNLFPRP